MSKLLQAAFISGLLTMFSGSIYYLFSLFSTLAANGNVVQTFIDCAVGSFLCWLFLTYVFYEILGVFEQRNEEGRKRLEELQKNEQNRNF